MTVSPEKQAVIATLDDMGTNQAALGQGNLLEPEESAEAWFIIERIERRLQQAREAAE